MLKTLKTLKTLIPGAMAGFLLLGASDAEACCVEVSLWAKVGLVSTSGVIVTEKLCIGAAGQILAQGFDFRTATGIQPRVTALIFTKNGDGPGGDIATLFCAANVLEEFVD